MSTPAQHAPPNTPAAEVLSQARRQAHAWTDFMKNFEGCFVQSIGGSQAIPDPFRIEHVLSSAERNGTINHSLDPATTSRLKAWISQQRAAIEQSFEARLRAFSESNNTKVDGRFPSYLLSGFLRVQVNPAKGACDIGDKHFDTLLLDSLAPTILAAVKEESQRSFDKAKFIGDLYHAYTRALALAKTSAGSAVPVKDVFFELVMVKQSPKFAKAPSKSNFQEYPKEFFLRDLAKLAASGSLATRSGKRLVLAPSAFSADAFPILEANAVRYIGRIAFTDSPDQ